MNFGLALALLKAGRRLHRQGWNGTGMFVYLVGPGRYPPTTVPGELIAKEHSDGLVPYRPYLALKTVDGDVVPWLASQTDILADDWYLAPGEVIDGDFLNTIHAADDAANDVVTATNELCPDDEPEEQVILFWLGGNPSLAAQISKGLGR